MKENITTGNGDCSQKLQPNTQNDENFQNECFQYIADFSKAIYENEEHRADSIIQQASRMQTAFSFVIAAVFMVCPVVIQYRGVLTLDFFFAVFSSISAALIFSLFAATMAQNKKKRYDYPSVSVFMKKVEEEYDNFKTQAQREKYLALTYVKMYNSLADQDDKRMKWISASMISFYCSLGLCVVWFLIAVLKMV